MFATIHSTYDFGFGYGLVLYGLLANMWSFFQREKEIKLNEMLEESEK